MAQLPIGGLGIFLAVAEHGSLRRAAAALGVRPPTISYRLKALEDQLGATLLARTTRSVRLTEAGRALLMRAHPAMSELRLALEDARGATGAGRGTLRITLPFVAYQLAIARMLAAFQRQHPEIELELSLNEAFVDIVAEGFHAGVRMGDHIHEDMIAIRLTPPLQEVFFAAPSYLTQHGRPRRPEDLLRHNCIRYRYIGSKAIAEWQFDGPDGIVSVDVKGGLIVNSTSAVVDAARNGLGIGWLFRPNIRDEMKARQLESVLDRYSIRRPGFFLYFPRENAQLRILRGFIDFMKLRAAPGRRNRRRARAVPMSPRS
jgi:DNA-binding transcriptional LysR family regulator